MNRFSRGAAGAAIVAMVGLAAATSTAGADDMSAPTPPAASTPVPEGVDLAAAAAQEQMEPYVEQVEEIGKKHQGLAVTAVDHDTMTVTVRWKGQAPPELTDLASADHDVVTVKVLPAKYSQAEINVAAAAALDALGDAAYSAGGNSDSSGLVVDVPPAKAKASVAATLKADVQEELTTETPELVGIPVTFEEGTPVEGLGRFNSGTPRKGGAFMTRGDGTGSCTTGFTVLNSAGVGKILSAAHCDPLGDHNWVDGGNDRIASAANVTYHHEGIDSLLMGPDGGTIGRVYIGTWNGTSLLDVAKAGPTAVGEYLCTGGAISGDHCSLRVTQQSLTYDCPGRTSLRCTGAVAENTAHGAATHGDSGGPVYYFRPSDSRVGARGIISGGTGATVSCPSMFSANDRCYTRVVFPTIAGVLDYWNVTLETRG